MNPWNQQQQWQNQQQQTYHPFQQTPYPPHPTVTAAYNTQQVYVPAPQYVSYWDGILNWKHPQSNRTPKYPSLNPILASDTTNLQLDMRRDPKIEAAASVYFHNRLSPAVASGTNEVRLISKSFPWTIDIFAPPYTAVTCEMVWDGVFQCLQHTIVDSEWGFIVTNEKRKRELVMKMAKRREGMSVPVGAGNIGAVPGMDQVMMQQQQAGAKVYKRIDYLGDATVFRGLERDDELMQLRYMPDLKPVSETWVVKMST